MYGHYFSPICMCVFLYVLDGTINFIGNKTITINFQQMTVNLFNFLAHDQRRVLYLND